MIVFESCPSTSNRLEKNKMAWRYQNQMPFEAHVLQVNSTRADLIRLKPELPQMKSKIIGDLEKQGSPCNEAGLERIPGPKRLQENP